MSKSKSKTDVTKNINFKNLTVEELEKIYESKRYEWLETVEEINNLNSKINPLVEKQKIICSDITLICNQINIKSDDQYSEDKSTKKASKKVISKVKTKSKGDEDTEEKSTKKVTKSKSVKPVKETKAAKSTKATKATKQK